MLSRVKQELLFTKRDLANIARFGCRAPKHSQLIFIDAGSCERLITWDAGYRNGLLRSAVIRKSDFWRGLTTDIEDHPKMRSILDHWERGIPWQETWGFRWTVEQALSRPGFEGCRSYGDVVALYEKRERLFAKALREVRLRTPAEVDPEKRRAQGAPLMHLGPHGEPIFGGAGYHRFCIARVLGIPLPCMVGAVHVSALPYYHQLTLPPDHPDRMRPSRLSEATISAS